jgi:hypothetical protein
MGRRADERVELVTDGWLRWGLHGMVWVAGERWCGNRSSLPQKKRMRVR